MNMKKLEEDLRDSISNLRHAVVDYWSGRNPAYKTAAVELRKLLCDSNPILPRVFDTLPMAPTFPQNAPPGAILACQMQVQYKNGAIVGVSIFDLTGEKLPLEEWLKQRIVSPEMTIRDLIRSVADKSGAHSDNNFNNTQAIARTLNYLPGTSAEPLGIIAISEYILSEYDMITKGSDLIWLGNLNRS